MNVATPDSKGPRTRLLVSFGIVATCLVGCVAIVLPRYRSEIVTVDGTHRWSSDIAPARREFVWQPPQISESLQDFPYTFEPSERPAFAEQGNVVCFSMMLGNANDDLVYSRREQGKWSEPKRVPEINSSGNDRGPSLNQRGDRLYFHSDRTGGFGGTDLYVSVREGNQWSLPLNLGSAINSPADECDVTISSNELHLFFASNRGESDWNPKTDHWTQTLPSDWRNHSFDLFQAERRDAKQDWKNASPIASFNTIRHDERSPFISSDNVYLWFASNRPDSPDDVTNFDLFRGRFARQDLPSERLGAEINSLSDEFAPQLSSNGFELQYSRRGVGDSSSAQRLQSIVKEVEFTSTWDRSRLDASVAILALIVSWFLDYFGLILLTISGCVLAAWLTRQLATRKFAVPGFLMLAMLLHFLLITGSFFVFFQQSITRRLKQLLIEEPVVATQVLIDSSDVSPEAPLPFDRVSELAEPMPIPATDIVRQTLAPVESQEIEQLMPMPLKLPTPAKANDFSGAEERKMVVASLPIQVPSIDTKPALIRAPISVSDVQESLVFEATRAVDTKPLPSITGSIAQVERAASEPQLAKLDILTPVTDRAMPVPTSETSDPLSPNTRELGEPITKTALSLTRRRNEVDDAKPIESPVDALEMIVAAESPKPVALQSPAPDMQQTMQKDALSIPQSQPIELKATNEGRIVSMPLARAESLPGMNESSVAPGKTPMTLSRALPIARMEAVSDEIIPENIASANADVDPIAAPAVMAVMAAIVPKQISEIPHAMDVAVARLGTDRPLRGLPETRGKLERSVLPIVAAPFQTSAQKNVTSALSRKVTKTSSHADARITLQSLLLRRKLDDETKQEVVNEFGGNDQTLVTIKRGLSWMERHQAADGHWGLHNFNEQCTDHPRCNGHGNTRSDTAATALALLPFLGDGHTHQQGQHKDVVARGIAWLIKQQKPDGNLFPGNDALAVMYSHGIATIALCECYGMTADPALREPSQKAIDFIVAAQDPNTGGWRYQPRNGADTSVVGWQIMALKSAQMAGLLVPEPTLQEAQRWLMSVAGKNDRAGQFAYQGTQYNPAISAEAMLCLEYLDHARDSEALLQSAAYLQKNLPQNGRDTSYYWYYGTQAMFHLQGEPWRQWNQAIHPLLIETQRKDGEMAGTWDPKDQWENSGGRIYGTSLRLLMLEVYYRHLPIYQAFGE